MEQAAARRHPGGEERQRITAAKRLTAAYSNPPPTGATATPRWSALDVTGWPTCSAAGVSGWALQRALWRATFETAPARHGGFQAVAVAELRRFKHEEVRSRYDVCRRDRAYHTDSVCCGLRLHQERGV